MTGRGPLLPDVRLYHDPGKALRRMRKLGYDGDLIAGVGAQTWARGHEAVVLMSYGGSDPIEEYALLVHEASHVVYRYFTETLMEEHAGEEMYAYSVQAVSAALMRTHDRWRKRKSDKRCYGGA